MTDTTGWRSGGRACNSMKDIDGKRYEIYKGPDDQWWAWQHNTKIGTYTALADAKRAAHDHARSKT